VDDQAPRQQEHYGADPPEGTVSNEEQTRHDPLLAREPEHPELHGIFRGEVFPPELDVIRLSRYYLVT
jgi:hypothetical protein